jgi:RHS repeat-associated core domain
MRRFHTLRLPLTHIFFFFFNTYSFSQDTKWDPNHLIRTITNQYNFSYNQIPVKLIEIRHAGTSSFAFTYQWEKSTTLLETNFVPISNAQSASYIFTAPLSQTAYYRRKTTDHWNQSVYSNIIKIQIVSVNWEDVNYIREHDIASTGISDWKVIDQLSIGQKLQTTSYLDGLGRPLEKISRESATPSEGSNVWGDVVQFNKYDQTGREPVKFLGYTTISESGKLKSDPITDQTQYYLTNYNETAGYSSISYDGSPLNRFLNLKEPGLSWSSGNGKSIDYNLNLAEDNVHIFYVDYTIGNVPINGGTYAANKLLKQTYTDENQKQVIEFSNTQGQVILRKVQIADVVSTGHSGWICTYNIYDEFGQLRYQLQPEAIKYLNANNWSFDGTDGQKVLKELCFQYRYDEKGRMVWKKNPGADPLITIYDQRDRPVFTQDGNQAQKSPGEWMATLYDELDRPVITTLYRTTKLSSDLQTDLDNSIAVSSVSITNPDQPVSDLTIKTRDLSRPLYTTRNSIEFVSEQGSIFESGTGDSFIAEIDPNAQTPGLIVTSTTFNNPIAFADLNNPSTCTILKYLFYDGYSFPGVKSFNTSYTNLSAYDNSDPNVGVIQKTNRAISMPTGSMTRVLGTNVFLNGTVYYDEKGRVIQRLDDNIKAGTDVTTMQYHFDGRLLSSCNNHSAPGTGISNFITLTKYLFDKIGRVTSIQKQFGSNAFKTISAFDYDDVGRVKTKHLNPGYTGLGGTELESLNYTFNIHNQVTGINKDYALKDPSTYNKWGHFFGLYIGYDNKDQVFTNQQLNGQVTGQLWNTQGDDAQRKYDYTYDNANRLSTASFSEQQHPADGWSNAKLDFSVSGSNGNIEYDLNGNLLKMFQKGVMPGTSTPVTIDDLQYSYATYSNKLSSVTDQMTSTNINGLSGDFKDGNNSGDDYVYDNNGNLVIDLNKNVKELANGVGANGISYNYLDKPEQIRIAGKGTIKIVYSADGEKLQRVFTPENGGPVNSTTYINKFIYQSTGNNPDALSLINFEEGRIRIIQPTSQSNGYDGLIVDGNMDMPLGKKGVYDYFIMDYQKNVRMILTEEVHSASSEATMETNRASVEDAIFGQQGAANDVESTRFDASQSNWKHQDIGYSVSRLGNLSGHNIGPNTLQKVMAGDLVSATVQYYHQATPTGGNSGLVSMLVNGLIQSFNCGQVPTFAKGGASGISNQLNLNNSFISAVRPSNYNGNAPKAFLTILFFDERFNFIAAEDGGVYQHQVLDAVDDQGSSLQLLNKKAPKNGYAYIYVSNESDQNVFFDNLKVGTVASNILEENHYYSFGLRIAAISSKRIPGIGEGQLNNQHQYQGSFNELDEDIGWNDFQLRNYDPQIGRWVQQDPYVQYESLYLGMGNDPINNIDPSGGETLPYINLNILTTTIRSANSITNVGHNFSTVLTVTSILLSTSNTLSSILNIPITTKSIGNEQGNWKSFRKSDLRNYYILTHNSQPTENDLGIFFEDIFYNYMLETEPYALKIHNFRRNYTLWDDANDRNTIPDFVSDAAYYEYIVGIPVKFNYVHEGSAWEAKQSKNRGVYLSSYNYQIKGHIDNLAARFKKQIAEGFWPTFTLITTADVIWSPKTLIYAAFKHIEYEQRIMQYKITNGKWEFRSVGILEEIFGRHD